MKCVGFDSLKSLWKETKSMQKIIHSYTFSKDCISSLTLGYTWQTLENKLCLPLIYGLHSSFALTGLNSILIRL